MGRMSKKHNRRVTQLEEELTRLEAINNPRLRVQHRIARIKSVELPKAQRHKART